ncbi:hypothetical protein BJF78_14405 [Pseudonocardia sp. CNS-139]|nr:hypothetical protein BJF78_14405 [Pseudonocardia sp. CNS-139]
MLTRLLGHGSPLSVGQRTWPYRRFHRMFDDTFPAGLRNYWKSGFLDGLSPDLVDAVGAHFREVPSARTVVAIEQMGGAIHRVPEASAAFPHRGAEYSLLATAMWDEPARDRDNVAWARALWSAVEPHTRGLYSNFLGEDTDDAQRAAAYGTSFERLRALKRRYDPQNLLRHNQTSGPDTGGRRRAGDGWSRSLRRAGPAGPGPRSPAGPRP